MESIIELQKKIVPELVHVMKERYTLLQNVELLQPIGRRGLAESTSLTERHVRSEIDFLHAQGLVEVTTKGMFITKEGKIVLSQLSTMIGELTGLHVLEKRIKETLPVDSVTVVPGDSDNHSPIKTEIGKATVSYLHNNLKTFNTIAVTGGSTIAAVADAMTRLPKDKQVLFVPARGGIGEKVENQASRIVAEMARKTDGEYRMLFVPDPISDSTYETIMKEPHIMESIEVIKSSNFVIHGVGDALKMAERRRSSNEVMQLLRDKKAVGEAFGYYFDEYGNVIYKVKTVGIQLQDIDDSKHVITVAGGTSKAKAIVSYFKQAKSNTLITDQGAAEEILRG